MTRRKQTTAQRRALVFGQLGSIAAILHGCVASGCLTPEEQLSIEAAQRSLESVRDSLRARFSASWRMDHREES